VPEQERVRKNEQKEDTHKHECAIVSYWGFWVKKGDSPKPACHFGYTYYYQKKAMLMIIS
jgi:hypothetical protein